MRHPGKGVARTSDSRDVGGAEKTIAGKIREEGGQGEEKRKAQFQSWDLSLSPMANNYRHSDSRLKEGRGTPKTPIREGAGVKKMPGGRGVGAGEGNR